MQNLALPVRYQGVQILLHTGYNYAELKNAEWKGKNSFVIQPENRTHEMKKCHTYHDSLVLP